MIKGLYETHLFVADIDVSIEFYSNMPGLELCRYETERRVAFFWIGASPKEAMLGLWEKPRGQIDKRHFAFRCEAEEVLNWAVPFLRSRNIKPYNFLNDGNERPMVFAWMPAVAIYFEDPDGHELEFIAVLEGRPRPELGVISYDEWEKVNSVR
jgi:catechol 2,3-dioxygenase-like lactoylglutathione lyase family enzyme